MSYEKLIQLEKDAIAWYGEKVTGHAEIWKVIRQYLNYLEDTKNIKHKE